MGGGGGGVLGEVMGAIFGKPEKPNLPDPPKMEDPDAKNKEAEAKKLAADLERRQSGRASTILAGKDLLNSEEDDSRELSSKRILLGK